MKRISYIFTILTILSGCTLFNQPGDGGAESGAPKSRSIGKTLLVDDGADNANRDEANRDEANRDESHDKANRDEANRDEADWASLDDVDSKKEVPKRSKIVVDVNSQSAEYASDYANKDSIELLFKKKQGDIKTCYMRVVNKKGESKGRFILAITVNKDGTVQRVDKVEDEIGGEMFNCVRTRLMNWNFGPLESPIAFRKTWVFD